MKNNSLALKQYDVPTLLTLREQNDDVSIITTSNSLFNLINYFALGALLITLLRTLGLILN